MNYIAGFMLLVTWPAQSPYAARSPDILPIQQCTNSQRCAQVTGFVELQTAAEAAVGDEAAAAAAAVAAAEEDAFWLTYALCRRAIAGYHRCAGRSRARKAQTKRRPRLCGRISPSSERLRKRRDNEIREMVCKIICFVCADIAWPPLQLRSGWAAGRSRALQHARAGASWTRPIAAWHVAARLSQGP